MPVDAVGGDAVEDKSSTLELNSTLNVGMGESVLT